MWGVRFEGVKEHSPSITGVSVDDTSMNWGFSLRKSFRRASARSACDVQIQYDGVGKRRSKDPPSDSTWSTPATHISLELNTQP